MTAMTEFFCDYCNPERERRPIPEDDIVPGYALTESTEGDGHPLGWWDVPGIARDGSPGHACPTCVLDPARFEDITERRSELTRRLLA